jgi:hypothetical protein
MIGLIVIGILIYSLPHRHAMAIIYLGCVHEWEQNFLVMVLTPMLFTHVNDLLVFKFIYLIKSFMFVEHVK